MHSVFQRNFIAYFLNPTGYVFICVFVLLSSIAAFLPDEFVNANLANLTQLNLWFPLIMVIFVPAITMGIWADERRQGTEELLMTMPLSPSQIVLGKYNAAVGIYTVSLLFSACSNYTILEFLGTPDLGLFLATYFGYWLMGLGMLAIAMVASFLTGQLTVAYILGALLNLPLLALQWADAAPLSHSTVLILKQFSLHGQFEGFERGIVSCSAIFYFFLIPIVMLYLCVVLLNRRQWTAKRPKTMFIHYTFRFCMLALFAVSLVGLVRNHDWRFDWTEEQLSSLSQDTLKLIHEQKTKYPVIIEAFLSPEVPQELVQTRLDIISVLHELQDASNGQVFLDIFETRPNTDEAYRLERQYDIRPKKIVYDRRGLVQEEYVFLSIIFRCGPKIIAIPFLNRGLSVEYELASAFVNVSDRPKKRLGILETGASLFGRFDAYGNQTMAQWPIIDELSKQYFIEPIDLSQPIPPQKYDVVLAVQPSSLPPASSALLADLLRKGQPTVLFEDPYPVFAEYLPGTKIPNPINPATGPFPPPKGELNLIWAMLGVTFDTDVLWKNYNPYPKLATLSEEYVFVDAKPVTFDTEEDSDSLKDDAAFPASEAAVETASETAAAKTVHPSDSPNDRLAQNRRSDSSAENDSSHRLSVQELMRQSSSNHGKTASEATDATSFSATAFAKDEPAVASLEHLLFPFTGSFSQTPRSETQFKPLIQTDAAGTASVDAIVQNGVRSFSKKRLEREGIYTLAALVTGTVPKAFQLPDAPEASLPVPPSTGVESSPQSANESLKNSANVANSSSGTTAAPHNAPPQFHVIVVGDVDLLTPGFFKLRETGFDNRSGIAFDFDNVTFVLNIIDSIAQDDSLISVRSRRPRHRTLTTIEETTRKIRDKAAQDQIVYLKEFEADCQKERESLEQTIQKLSNQNPSQSLSNEESLELQSAIIASQQRLNLSLDSKQQQYNRKVEESQRQVDEFIRKVQGRYKFFAILFPPILPIMIGFGVWVFRKRRQRSIVR